MAEEKVYHPEEIVETPFPGEPIILDTQTQPSSDGNYTPTTTKEKTFPEKRIAVELLSTALNTRSRKILEEFELQQSGGFQIGDFKQGKSGDLRITPNGITARDIVGLTTFAIDGTTGDLILLGELRSGSVITGSLITGEVTIGEDNIKIDGENRRIIISDGTNDRVLIGFQDGGF